MQIDGEMLRVDTPVSDEEAVEFFATINQPQIHRIVVENDELGASIVQLLWCVGQEKEVVVESPFLKRFFENVQDGEESV